MKPEPLIDENVSAMRSVTMPTVRSVMKDRLTSRIAFAKISGRNGRIALYRRNEGSGLDYLANVLGRHAFCAQVI